MVLAFNKEDFDIQNFISKMKDYFSSAKNDIESNDSFSKEGFLKFKNDFAKSYGNFTQFVENTKKSKDDESFSKQIEFMDYFKNTLTSIDKNFSKDVLLSSLKIATAELCNINAAENDKAEDENIEENGDLETEDEKQKYDPKLYPYRKITKKERKYGKRFYECIISFRQDKSNVTCRSCIESIFNIIQDGDGLCKSNPKYLGLRSLLSRIGKKNKKCHMYSIKYEGSAGINQEIESLLKSAEKIVRYLILRVSNIDSNFYNSSSINTENSIIDRKYFVKLLSKH